MVKQALVLCGGSGTRLGALTAARPKPLLPIQNRPFLDVLLFALGRQGLAHVVLLASFEAEQIQRYALHNPIARRFGIELEVVVEPVRAGTGGALHHARAVAEDEFLLMNGDTWFDFAFGNLVRAGSNHPGATAVLTLRTVPDASRYGLVMCEAGRVTEFQNRPTGQGPGLVNAGVYLMRRAIFQHLEPVCSLEKDVLPRLASSGSLGGVVADGFFLDIGVPSAYDQAQQEIPARMRELFRAA